MSENIAPALAHSLTILTSSMLEKLLTKMLTSTRVPASARNGGGVKGDDNDILLGVAGRERVFF